MDRAFGLRTLGGLFVGGSGTNAQIDGRLDEAEVESLRLGLYGRYEHECGLLTGVLSYADNDFDVSRRLLIGGIDRAANAKYSGHGVSAFVEASTNIKRGGWEIFPAASMQYTKLQSGGFGESGANSLNLIGNQVRTDSALASIGARVTYPTETSQGRKLVPEVRARYMREMRGGDARLFTARLEGAPTNAFTVVGADPGKDFAVVGAGVTYQTGDSSNVFVSYDAQLSESADTHSGEAGVQMKF